MMMVGFILATARLGKAKLRGTDSSAVLGFIYVPRDRQTSVNRRGAGPVPFVRWDAGTAVRRQDELAAPGSAPPLPAGQPGLHRPPMGCAALPAIAARTRGPRPLMR